MWNCGQRARSRGNSRDAGKDGENAPVPLKAARSRMRPENSWQSQRTRVVIEGGDAGLVRYACRRVAALPLHGQCPHARAGTLASQQVALAGCVQQHCARTLISGTARARAISAPDDGFAPCLRRVVFYSLCAFSSLHLGPTLGRGDGSPPRVGLRRLSAAAAGDPTSAIWGMGTTRRMACIPCSDRAPARG